MINNHLTSEQFLDFCNRRPEVYEKLRGFTKDFGDVLFDYLLDLCYELATPAVWPITPEDFNSDRVDADGALPCWIEVDEETSRAWIQQYGFDEGTVFSGWTTVKRDEIGDPEDGCTYWTGNPANRK